MREWSELRIGDHIELLSGFPFESGYFDRAEGIRLVRIRDLLSSDEKTYFLGKFEREWLVSPGDILIGMDGDFNVVRWAECQALLNQRILRARVKAQGSIREDFFFYWCSPWLAHTNARTAATTVKHLSATALRDAVDRFPPEIEQRRIAEILSTLDEAIEQTEALIAKYQQIKTGLMQDLFTRGLTPDGHLRPTRTEAPHLYKQSPLGWIPVEWNVRSVADLFHRRTERGRLGLPVMSITMSDGLVERDSTDRRVDTNLTPEAHLLVRDGDIAYNMMRMWQGVLGRGTYDCLVSPAYVVLTPKPLIISEFAHFLLRTDSAIAKFKHFSYGVVDDRLRLYYRDLVRICFPLPVSTDEQSRIVENLNQADQRSAETFNSLTKLRQLKAGLMQDLLTGRVRVPLPELTTV